MAVISVSRQVGSGGHEIAQVVSARLGYRLLDHALMNEIARAAGLLQAGQVVDLTAERHHVAGGFERHFVMAPGDAVAFGAYEASGLGAENRSAELVSKILLLAYAQGDIVVEGRGSQGVLRDRPGVLSVRIVAPVEQRVRSLMQRDDISAEEARRKVKEADSAQAGYIRRYFNADISDLTLYDLMINTSRLPVEAAADLIVKALTSLPTHP